MIEFIDNDQDYLDWVSQNPDQYVINAERKPRAANIRLHRATCRQISGVPSNGKYWTKSYLKLAGHRAELEGWCRESFGVEPWICPLCL